MTDRLTVSHISRRFGGLVVSDDVTISLPAGARTALIGPNGAGKTTLINIISGALTPDTGSISVDGKDVTGFSQPERVEAGIARTFQINRLFKDLTAADNVRVAVIQQQHKAFQLWQRRAVEDELDRRVHDVMSKLRLTHRADTVVSKLAYGEQRLLEIAMALALEPRVLLLDEPAAGVPKGESNVIIEVVQGLPKDLAVLLIDHDMDLVFRFASYIYVLASGAVVTGGTPAEIAADEKVKEIYFGRESHDLTA